MDAYNVTTVTQFILIGLSDLPEVRYPLFVAFAIIYQVTLVGNGAILLAISTEAKLHTPMYYFLANLSLLDMFSPYTTVPKMLWNIVTEEHSISFVGCALSCISWWPWLGLSCSSCLSWLMTVTWPSASHFTTLSS